MDTLLPIEPQLLPAATLLLQRGWRRPIALVGFVRRADQVDGGGEVRGARGGGDGGAGEEEFG